MSLDLALVMPVYNEEDSVIKVVKSWRSALSRIHIDFKIIVLNDGSNDKTSEKLFIFSNDDRVEVINKPNSGHGPTILMGYHIGAKIAHWVFQCDSDNEMKPDYFPYLWQVRESYDALFGVRKHRNQNLSRKFISVVSRFTVHLMFGKGVTDVNTPYRLIQSSILRKIIRHIPNDTFAPNVIISGILSRSKARIYEYSVPHETRRTGKVSITKWKLWKSAVKSFWQTLLCRRTIKMY
jgi:dolichol-phosphate mannosyltransferase